MPRPKDYTNQKFGKLTALEFTGKYYLHKGGSKRRIWKYQCDCGNICEKLSEKVIKGWTKSCGCLQGKYKGVMAIAYGVSGEWYNDGDISFDKFYELSQQNCHYCGTPPFNNRKGVGGNKHLIFTYNGLDRKNNDERAHNINNCVPCCWTCNQMKKDMSYEVFINKIKTIYDRLCK